MIDIQLYKTLLNNAAVELKSISRSRYFNDGKNFTMSIPLQSADSDVIFTEALVAMRELIAHVEELKDVEARAEAAERRIVKLEIALRKIADQVDRKYGPLPTSGAKRLALEALKEEVEE